MRNTLDPADLEFLSTLRRLGPRTVQGLGEALGVTATAIRQKLTRLQACGHIERRLVREGRGRPHHEYLVTDKAMRELGDNYGDLATILWREVQRISDPTVRAFVTDRVRDSLVARLGHIEGESLKERLGQLERNLRSRGYDVEVDSDSADPVLRENNCPYHELADQDRGICELEQEVFEKVLGAGVTLSRCCLDGHSCCEFSVAESVPVALGMLTPRPETGVANGVETASRQMSAVNSSGAGVS
jgi:predicted ArsR family transcriptional regulator